MTEPTAIPSVLFVCVKNGGKSPMAAALMREATGDTVHVDSAGTKPGTAVNALSAQTLLEDGIDITSYTPKALTPELITRADLIVVLGPDAHVHPADGTPVQIWDTDEPADRGIDGIERMRLDRDSIAQHVNALAAQLKVRQSRTSAAPPHAATRRSPGRAT